MSTDLDGVLLRNEFGVVWLGVDRRGRTPRLRITDMDSRLEHLFDPLELALLAGAGPEALRCWMESFGRLRPSLRA